MSKTRLSLVITAVAVLSAAAFEIVSAGVVRPALAADASNGMRVAELWCAACHVVTVSQPQANADAPPFEEIAERPNFSEPGLVIFLLDPHAKMPNMNLTRIEANDIAANPLENRAPAQPGSDRPLPPS
jgi:mono/diheme cytochrome c family protein